MRRFAVIGLGKFGFHLAKALFEDGHEVIAIDKDKDRVQEIQPFSTQAVVADIAHKEILKTLGMDQMDAVLVSIGEDIAASILVTLYLKELKVKQILVKAMNEDHGKILERIGATEVIYPEKAMALKTARSLSTPNILDFIPMVENYTLVELAPPTAFIGKTLSGLDLRVRHNVYVIGVKEVLTDNFILVPPADFVVKDSDILFVIGHRDNIAKLEKL
ncbi:MAG: TrkA family potassium uptake protein [Thermodesulfobacteriota bacterium]|nr:TrkA family potassium uptake protein [Thermodesulfobacteriota bacterium]